MSVNSNALLDELIKEQSEIMKSMSKSNDLKDHAQKEKALNLISSLIKSIYKYNQYYIKKITEPAPTLLKQNKNLTKIHF
jgi:hypothetical protein